MPLETRLNAESRVFPGNLFARKWRKVTRSATEPGGVRLSIRCLSVRLIHLGNFRNHPSETTHFQNLGVLLFFLKKH